jgi:Glucodextranase, domain B
MEITPGGTKTYTIIADSPAGTAIKTVTVTVNLPTVPPTINMSANPETIIFGHSASLIWNSTHAYSCSIEPGIGKVGLNGSINVSPDSTTTYTITASGYAGTATSSATVTVIPLPTVNFSANPLTIMEKESTTLSWNSANADSCVIEPGIGSVDLNGSSGVSPAETTTYTITATGPGGEASGSVTVNVTSPVSLQITSPVHMQNITRPDILVEGTISDSLGIDIGVTVNGQAATIFNGQFVANHVPLQEGENTITVIGTDSKGYTATAGITVYAQTTGDNITITADSESGVSPFETNLQMEGTFDFSQEPVVTPTGPDDVAPFESLGKAQYQVGMSTPGVYYFTAQATDGQSNTYTDRIAVVVLDHAQLDALLRAKWDGMRNALTLNDIDNAVKYFDSSTKDAFKNAFSGIIGTAIQFTFSFVVVYGMGTYYA